MIQFQAPILDAMSMRSILTQQGDLRDKLDQVRAAALEFANKRQAQDEAAADETSLGQDPDAEAEAKKKKDKAEKKKKKNKKEKKKAKRKRKLTEEEGDEEEESVV